MLERGSDVLIVHEVSDSKKDLMIRIGFSPSLEVGEQVLPAAELGPVTRFNAVGKYIVHRDEPMETVTRQREWRWTEFHGRYRVERWDVVDTSYQRYPRTFTPPPGLELTLVQDTKGQKWVASPTLTVPLKGQEGDERDFLHVVNLFLEIFRQCEVRTSNFEEIIRAPVRRMNWTLLPRGRWPWERLEIELEPVIRNAPTGNQPVIRYRFELINSFSPEFYAVGQAGFRGYVVFGFPKKGLYVLESLETGNATYIFGEDWEELSKLTKREILAGQLHRARVVHTADWKEQIRQLLSA